MLHFQLFQNILSKEWHKSTSTSSATIKFSTKGMVHFLKIITCAVVLYQRKAWQTIENKASTITCCKYKHYNIIIGAVPMHVNH